MNFRYIVFIIFIGLVTSVQINTLYAQNPTKPKIFAYNVRRTPTFSIKGGLLVSTVTGDEAIDQYAKKIGPQIGITGAYYISPMLSFRGELNYELKGGKFANQKMQMDLHYATIPIYLKFNFTRDPEVYIYLGAYASYLIAAKTTGTYEIDLAGEYIYEPINEKITSYLNKIDIGIVGGVGSQGRLNSWSDIFLDIRYTQGFINLDNQTSELRYNFNYVDFWPEKDVGKPMNKAFMLTTGLIIYIDSR